MVLGLIAFAARNQAPAIKLGCTAMITFRVVKEQYGWAVRMNDCVTTPFRSRELAIREADCLARELRAHGQRAVIEVDDLVAQKGSFAPFGASLSQPALSAS